jgi:hypothetical protein
VQVDIEEARLRAWDYGGTLELLTSGKSTERGITNILRAFPSFDRDERLHCRHVEMMNRWKLWLLMAILTPWAEEA